MAHHKSALKRIRQSNKLRLYNKRYKKAFKTAIKAVRISKNYDEAFELLRKAGSILDKVAAKGIIHKNKAANNKSRLTKYVKSLKTA